MTAWRIPFVVGSAGRLAYGLGSVLAPDWMSDRLAPPMADPDARMALRGFGGAHSAIAVYTLATARTEEGARSTLRLNLLADAFDTAVSLLERRDRGEFDRSAAGGVAINVLGLGCWATAAALLRR